MSGILRFCCDSARAQDHTLMTVSTFRYGVRGVGIRYDVGLYLKNVGSKALKWFETCQQLKENIGENIHPSCENDPCDMET